MQKIDPFLLSILSDFLIDIAAAWFAAAVIIPALSDKSSTLNILVLIANIIGGILSLLAAYYFRKKQK